MSTDLEAAVEQFLRRTDATYAEYEQGYRDADATLRELRGHVDGLRAAVPNHDESGG